MNGQTKSFREKQQIADEFIACINPYKKQPPMRFDFRGYAAYVKQHGLTNETITESVMEKFKR